MNELKGDLPEGFKITELGPLPEEWEVVRLGDIAEKMKAGGTPRRGVNEYWGGDIPFVLIGDMTSCYLYLSKTKETLTDTGLNNSNAWLVPPNTILLSMYATIGETAINTIPVATNQAILAIVPKNNFNTVFGAYLLKYNAQRLTMQNIQSTQKNVNKGIVENFKIPLPPLPEQEKIAAILSAVQEAKEKTEAVISATRDLKKSMMNYLFTYGPVPVVDAENIPQKETEIGMIPEEWEVVNFSEIGKFQYGYTESGSTIKIGPKFLRITDIDLTSGNINWSSVPYCKISDVDYPKYELYDGDVLVARIGATTGKTCIIKNPPKSVFASYLIRFIHDKEKVDPFFVYYFTNSKKYWAQVNASKEGKLKKGVSSSQLKIFRAPLPPLPTQQKIASMLSAIDQKIEAEENKKKALEDLFKTLLHNLMTAKIRVNSLEVGV